MRTRKDSVRAARPLSGARLTTAGLLSACLASVPAWGQTTQAFTFDSALDVGSGLGKVGDPNRWEYDLGFDWDQDFRLGTIVGSKNTTIIPEVKVLGKTIIPKVTADTRTGARFTGNISGGTGLVFYADYDASGVEAGTAFNYAPEIDLPGSVRVGEFTALTTRTGLIDDGSFNESLIDLPSFEAGMDFYFNLDLKTDIEAGLFPVIPYSKTTWDPAPINVNQSLLKFEFDLDPDSNPATAGGVPPTFTMFEDTLFESKAGLLDDGSFVLDKQVSVEVEDKVTGIKNRVDIGEVQVINPFGTDAGGFLGNTGNRNLEITTSLANDTISYTAQSDILRLGIDLDGIAAFLGTGKSFTRLDEEIGVNPFDTSEPFASVVGDFIDIKYGPEIGYRETVDVKTDFNVRLSFKDTGDNPTDVALDDNGALSINDQWTGKWSDLPEIAILGTDNVEVEVEFLQVTGEQTKRGVFYLTDYLQLTLLELESLNILDIVDLSLPPVYRGRTSLLGSLLGEFELEVTNLTEEIAAFDVSPTLAGGANFTLEAAPTVLVYSANTDGGLLSPVPATWRRLADGTTPTTLAGTTIFIGYDNMAASILSTADTEQMTLNDPGGSIAGGTAQITADALQLPAGSTLHQLGGQRVWDITRVANDGTILTNGYTQLGTGNGVLQVTGDGTIHDSFGELSFQYDVVINGPGHTIVFDHNQESMHFDSGPFHFMSSGNDLVNVGTIHYLASGENSFVMLSNEEDAVFKATDGSFVELFNGTIRNNGLVLADTGSTIIINQSGTDTLTAPGGRGVFRADNGSLMRFKGSMNLGDLSNTNPANVSQLVFEVGAGSEIDFEGQINQAAGYGDELTVFNVEQGGTLRLNGLKFPGVDGTATINPSDASNFLDITNDGTIILESGRTFLFVQGTGSQNPGGGGDPPDVPTATPLNLVNRGEIVIEDDALFSMEIEIADYAEGGAALTQGEWTLIGETPGSLYSNQSSVPSSSLPLDGLAVLDFRVVGVSNNGTTFLSLAGFEDTNGDGLITEADGYDINTFETDLAINATTVTLSGKALFKYFNTLEDNQGTLNLLNRQNFITRGDLVNTGTINLASNARLDVQGRLTVGLGGVVNVEPTQAAETARLDFNTLEIIGGTVNIDGQSMLNEGLFGSRDDGYLLNTGVSIIVRDDVSIEQEGVEPVITPGVFNLTDGPGKLQIARNDGTIIIDGTDAVFDLAKGLLYNHGTLEIRSGHVWQSPNNDFRNAQTMLLQAGQFLINGTFRNDGDLTIDAESYLKATTFISDFNSTIQLDGVVEADSILVEPGSMITGSGRFSGNLLVDGAFEPGNSAGLFSVFQDLTLSDSSSLALELDGTDAGETYDQVFVDGLASFDGTLELDIQSNFISPGVFQWLLVEAEQSAGSFDAIFTLGLDPASGDPLPARSLDPTDVILGQHNGRWLFLSYFGGDGNDLVLYTDFLYGDTDNDHDIDNSDLQAAIANFTGPGGGFGKTIPLGDSDADGDVDNSDLQAAIANFTGPNPTRVPGDTNGDGDVDNGDLQAAIANFTGPGGAGKTAAQGDTNGDGAVSNADLQIAIANFTGPNPTPIPEPGSLALLAIGGLLATRRRRGCNL